MNYVTRWLFSTSHKDIGILYMIFGMICAMVATAMSVIIRLELSGPGPMFLHGNNQVFNVLVTGHAIAMIFLFVMPFLIGGFGNYFLPIMIGGVDMAFARLNNISFWCLPPALVCVIASLLIETGAGTGWTVDSKLFIKMSFDAWKTLVILWHAMFYSYLLTVIINVAFLGRGSHAWVHTTHQRLHMTVLKLNYLRKKRMGLRPYKARVNDRDNHLNFKEWLVGFTDGDGTFNIYVNQKNSRVTFTYKLSQSIYNEQVLYKIKKELGIGRITKDKARHMTSYVVTKREDLIDVILPIFDEYPLLSSKHFNYIKFKKALNLYTNKPISTDREALLLEILKIKELTITDIQNETKDSTTTSPLISQSPVWNNMHYSEITSVNQVKNIASKSWLTGFIEAEGSFFLTQKSANKLVHSFGITQKYDPIILYVIKMIFHIKSSVRFTSNQAFYLETTSKRSLLNIVHYFITKDHSILFKGAKNLEFSIWKRSFMKYSHNYTKHYPELTKVTMYLRNLRNKHKLEDKA